jgi:transcriptional regulator with XRE-family HTH domain
MSSQKTEVPEENIQMSPGSRLAWARSIRKMSQAELGKALGKTKLTIGRWERGITPIPSIAWGPLAVALDVTVDYLRYGANPTESNLKEIDDRISQNYKKTIQVEMIESIAKDLEKSEIITNKGINNITEEDKEQIVSIFSEINKKLSARITPNVTIGNILELKFTINNMIEEIAPHIGGAMRTKVDMILVSELIEREGKPIPIEHIRSLILLGAETPNEN